MWHTLVHWFLDRRVRYTLSWFVLLAAIGGRGYTAWTNFASADRVDGNDGHTSIDFAGQWLLGRMLATGHGHELYSRERHFELARQAFLHERENPTQETHDAEHLIQCYPGASDDPVGGPLYPPIHAYVMLPLGLIADPQIAYRICQLELFLIIGFTGVGVRYLTRGRWWWTMATAAILLAPGCRGGTDLGQNSPLTLGLLIWGWALIVRGHVTWGGIVWGLLAFKPVWAVSFVGALLLLQQWRAMTAMILTGLMCIVATLPTMGLQAWFDWLHIGKMATETYCVDRNWIFLSRDLFGIPRRIWLDFQDGRAVVDRPMVGVIGWGLWLTIAGLTALTTRKCFVPTLTGPFPAFVFCAAWMCTYRFIYYDALLALLAVVTLLADPRRYWAKGQWWPYVFVAAMFVIENITGPMHIEITAKVYALSGQVIQPNGASLKTAPAIYLSSTDDYPWDTVAVFLLWLHCGWKVWRCKGVVIEHAPLVRV